MMMSRHDRKQPAAALLGCDDLNPELRPVVANMKRLLGKQERGDLPASRELGQWVYRLLVEEAVYGHDAVERVARHLGLPPARLYRHRDLFLAYSAADVAAMAEHAMPDGSRLTPGHLFTLLHVKSTARRAELLRRAVAGSWGVNELADVVVADLPRRSRSGVAGPRKARPPSVTKGLAQLITKADQMTRAIPNWQTAVMAGIDEMEPARVTEALLAAVSQAHARVQSLLAGLAACDRALEQSVQRIRRVLRVRADLAEARRDAEGDGGCGDGVGT